MSLITHDGKIVSAGGKGLTFDSLIALANATTGEDDKTLATAIASLIDGYGDDGHWKRPAEWPQYTDEMVADMDGGYFTFDTSIYNKTYFIPRCGSGDQTGPIGIVERGHIENGVFVVDETLGNVYRNAVQVNSFELDPSNGRYQCVRLKYIGTKDGFKNFGNTNVNNLLPNKSANGIVEFYGRLPWSESTYSSDRQIASYDLVSLTILDLGINIRDDVLGLMTLTPEITKLENLDVYRSNFTTIKDFSQGMRAGMVDHITLSDFTIDGSGTWGFQNMFSYCRNAKYIDLSECSFVNTTGGSLASMFDSCALLQTILFPDDIDFSSCSGTNRLFAGCYNLRDIPACFGTIDRAWSISDTQATRESIVGIFNNMPTVSGVTFTLGARLLYKLSDADKLIATNKGWTLV